MNPIQALKHRRIQQQQEIEERKHQQQQGSEERRPAQAKREDFNQHGSSLSQPPSPQASLSPPFLLEDDMKAAPTADSIGRPPALPQHYEDHGPGAAAAAATASAAARGSFDGPVAALTPLERRAQRQQAQSPRGSAVPSSVPLGTQARPADGAAPSAGGAEEVRSAPTTLTSWRPPSSPRSTGASADSPRASSAQTSATDRLRERMMQRQGNKIGERTPTAASSPSASGRPHVPTGIACSWEERIAARRREAEEEKTVELEHNHRVSERSNLRSDAMRRVVERQAERKQDVATLDA